MKSRTVTAVWATVVMAAGPVGAQMPGAPVLQNAWAAPGIVVAGNFAGGNRTNVYGLAAGWAPASGRFQLSGGAGAQSASGAGSRAVYGARLAFPLRQIMNGRLGIAGFAGIGGGSGKAGDVTRSNTVVPAGLALGYRQAVGTNGRGFSFYADPHYQHHSASGGSKGFFRTALGLDAGISPRIGLTVGIETGAKAGAAEAGPRGTTYGVGASMKLGR